MKLDTRHGEWLSLMDVSGPFISLPVLREVFPQGLDGVDAEVFRMVRDAYSEWREHRYEPAYHLAWLRFVLHDVLGYPPHLILSGQELGDSYTVHVPGQYEKLRPDMVLCDPAPDGARGLPRLLIMHFPAEQKLDRRIAGMDWKASPLSRMQELLLRAPVDRGGGRGVELGLVTNGEEWALVYAPRSESACFATWYADIWMQERQSYQAFVSLLCQRRLTGVADTDTLEALFTRSLANQQEVTDQLGTQVRRAVEVLVQTLDRIDRDRGRSLLSGVSEQTVYDAALTFMMRLVFLFSAEENGLLLLGDPLYDASYSVSLLRAQLREEADRHTEEVLSHRTDAWCRLLAVFRAVYGGIAHERLPLPAYGGRLFDPDRYPFLEGRAPGTHWRADPAQPLPVDNRTVLHLLCALQELELRAGKGQESTTRILSFRGLDIEQIGHVYEGLLDHTAKRATEAVLGLAGSREPEIALSKLEELRAKGRPALVDFLTEQTGRSEKAVAKALDAPAIGFEHLLLTVCGGDSELQARVMPYSALLRFDSRGYPVVIPPGSLYVTQGSLRRSTGTHYTQRTLTEPIVRHTLEPLVYDGPAEGLPLEQWQLRSPRELLALRVCDMAMGSGAFLVQACRYLGDRLLEAWEREEARHPAGTVLTAPYAEPPADPVGERVLPRREDVEERATIARRLIAERCLYGVDINPMAVEMAKLSLWLTTMSKGKPFSFLDHALKCGDSLLGVDERQLATWSLKPAAGQKEWAQLSAELEQAADLRRRLEAIPGEDIAAVEHKQRLHAEAERRLSRLKLAGDLLLAPHLGLDKAQDIERESQALFGRFVTFQPTALAEDLTPQAAAALNEEDAGLRQRAAELFAYTNNEGEHKRHTPFHWHLEFPEVFLHGDKRGFDAFVGNPPFLRGKSISGQFNTLYREYLVDSVASKERGNADLCTYFFLRAYGMLAEQGMLGMLATNTIAQGDTRQVGLCQIAKAGGSIVRAYPSRKWPGAANLEVAEIWIAHDEWHGNYITENKNGTLNVIGITPYLAPPGQVTGEPYQLITSESKAYIGSLVLGMGFILSIDNAQNMISNDSKYNNILFPFLRGEDLTSQYNLTPTCYVINFFDWPLRREECGSWISSNERERERYLRDGVVPIDYQGSVAADYPAALEIVMSKVKPERDELRDGDSSAQGYAKFWWRFARRAIGLYEAISDSEHVLVRARTANLHSIAIVPSNYVYNENIVAFAGMQFVVLQSTVHDEWSRKYSQSIRTDMQYSPTKASETFPFPESLAGLEDIGGRYYAHRQSIMQARQEGLTATYNRFHNPAEATPDIAALRTLHVEMDHAVSRAYGWDDLELGHGFHSTKQGLRYTVSEPARLEILDRLLALNITRYAQEVAQGLHNGDKKLTPAKITELCDRLSALGRDDLIEAVKNRPTGKPDKSASARRAKGKIGGSGALF